MKFPYRLNIDSTLAKLNHADRHFQALKREIADFVAQDFILAETKTYREALTWVKCSAEQVDDLHLDRLVKMRKLDDGTYNVPMATNYMAVSATLLKDVPAVEWGLAVGDILNNLRGALDSLVWACTEAEKGPSPILGIKREKATNKWRAITFPVTLDQSNWQGDRDRALWGLRPSLQSRVRKHQPFFRRKNTEGHWLALLHELWNADKHRIVTPVVGFHGLGNPIHLEVFWPDRLTNKQIQELLDVRLLKIRPVGAFRGQSETIARFRIRPRKVTERIHQTLNLRTQLRHQFDIAFDDRSPGAGKPVTYTLEGLFNRTAAVITEFQLLAR